MKRVIIESPTFKPGAHVSIPGKRCTKCDKILPRDTFCKDKKRSDGKHPWCRYCVKAYRIKHDKKPETIEKIRTYQREYARRPKRKQQIREYQRTDAGRRVQWKSKLFSKYGLTEAAYAALVESQGGKCAVCQDPLVSTRHTHVDHCHKTGVVRGILCHNCNRALGAARDSPVILRGLIAYLGRTSCGA